MDLTDTFDTDGLSMNLVLSIEDTNKLRLKVGLKPIPIPENNSLDKKRNLSQNNADSKILEFSIEETNKFRKQLGLRLIVDESKLDDESRNYLKLKENERRVEKISNLKANLQKKKNEIRTKHRVERGGVLARIEGKGEVMDIDSWLDKVGKDVREGGIKKLSFKTKDKGKKEQKQEQAKEQEQEQEQTEEQTQEQDEKTTDLINDQNEILTAKDVNVLDDSVNCDAFENRQVQRDQNIKKSLDAVRDNNKLVSLNDLEKNDNDVNALKRRKVELLDIKSENEFDNGDDDNKISKFFKRDVSKFKKLKKSKSSESRKTVFDTELVDKKFTPIVLDNDETDDTDDLDKILSATRQSNLKKRKFEYDDANYPNNLRPKQSELFSENLEFLDNIKVDDMESALPARIVGENANEAIEPVKPTASTRYKAMLESENERNYNTYGVSSILNVLKSTANDKDKAKNGNDIEIVYTDDNGKVLNKKEAFKYLSHKFHGSKKN